MTSYANEPHDINDIINTTTTTIAGTPTNTINHATLAAAAAAAGATTPTTTGTGGISIAGTSAKASTIPTTTTATIKGTLNKMQHSNTFEDYEGDSSSMSDGREKADTTPENIKKIDDIIEQQQHQQQMYQTHFRPMANNNNNNNSNNNNNNNGSNEHAGYMRAGFAAAAANVDDSTNAKFCLAKPTPPPRSAQSPTTTAKEMICKVEHQQQQQQQNHFESGNITPSSIPTTPTTAAAANDNNNKDSNKSAIINNNDDDDSTASNTTTTTATKQSFAFTIDNFNDKESDPAAQAARYKSMMERFQSRHRRGASMSKLEQSGNTDMATSTMTSSMSATPLTNRNARNRSENIETATDKVTSTTTTPTTTTATAPKVKLRARDRSTSRVRDAAKRHSWSPRSSTHELSTPSQAQTPTNPSNSNTTTTTSTNKNSKFSQPKRATGKPPTVQQVPKGAANLMANRTQFMPRSTAMQLALQKVDFLCPQPPLADFKQLHLEADNISEAGTYTLDGDNYTEEQKDLMNIDNKNRQQQKRRRAKTLDDDDDDVVAATPMPKTTTTTTTKVASNVLEVNYYHDSATAAIHPNNPSLDQRANSDFLLSSHQSAGAYLEKIKSRVLRNMCETTGKVHTISSATAEKTTETTSPEKNDDIGCFTSVTTSGVLAKQSALDARPKLTRRSSLSTSQIDSSEYVSNEAKLKANAAAYAAGGYTDHQKAEYRLNVFTNQKDAAAAAKFAATRQLISSPPDTPSSGGMKKLSDTAVLQTAQTKHDWIQEWARNARARSLAHDQGGKAGRLQQQELMTRSYTCATASVSNTESLTDDSIYNKKLQRIRLTGGGAETFDYASDPALCSGCSEGPYKPPKSPTKIPSPLHSIGRARSASRTRTPLGQLVDGGIGAGGDAEEASIYLQKTAAAISNLQQSLSRKNSLRSPTNSATTTTTTSPRNAARTAGLYSPEQPGSPQHSLAVTSPTGGMYQRRSPRQMAHHYHQHQQQQQHHHSHHHHQQQHHQHQHQLMTSSFNEQQLQLLTSGEYLMRQLRMRKNSFDGQVSGGQASPGRKLTQQYVAAELDEQSLSPLRRSSSYSMKIATQRPARPQYQNIYTPPAARHNYTLATAPKTGDRDSISIKKSASSNNFGQIYSDYDENLQYYINDEDEGADNDGIYYSSGAEDDEEEVEYDCDEVGVGYYQSNEGGDQGVGVGGTSAANNGAMPLSHARYNKALLMRIERSKQKVQSKPPSSAPSARLNNVHGLIACPNTPELPRRHIKSATSRLGGGGAGGGANTSRQSMPRDTSLSRLARQVPNSLASAKKQLLQTAAAGVPAATSTTQPRRVQPKYMDISKYKPAQSNAFLRKNDSKSTLKQPVDAMRRSPSSSSMGLTRGDPTRASNRSVRSMAACMTASGTTLGSGGGGSSVSSSGGRTASAVRRDASIAKQKEAEMAMWKRRSTYDPMKAAAEDRRKKEEAKRVTLLKTTGGEVPCERPSRSPYRRVYF